MAVVVTDVMDAAPVHNYELPEPTIWPFLCAVVTSAFFVGSIFSAWALPISIIPLAVTLIGWFWPKGKQRTKRVAAPLSHGPVGTSREEARA